jgi:hypothetical protein
MEFPCFTAKLSLQYCAGYPAEPLDYRNGANFQFAASSKLAVGWHPLGSLVLSEALNTMGL